MCICVYIYIYIYIYVCMCILLFCYTVIRNVTIEEDDLSPLQLAQHLSQTEDRDKGSNKYTEKKLVLGLSSVNHYVVHSSNLVSIVIYNC